MKCLFVPVITVCLMSVQFDVHAQNTYVQQAPVAQVASDKTNQVQGVDVHNVDLYHGTANVRIPIYEYELNGMDYGISLGYDCRGIRVDQLSSVVGLGWSLQAGFDMSRTIEGVADEFAFEELKGASHPVITPPGSQTYVSKVRGYQALKPSSEPGYIYDVDGSQDVYSIGLPGSRVSAVIMYGWAYGSGYLITYPKTELDINVLYSYINPVDGKRYETTSHIDIEDGRIKHGIGMGDSSRYLRYDITDEKGTVFSFDRGTYRYAMHDYKEWPFMIDSFVYYPIESWNIREVATITGERIKYYYKRVDNVRYPLYKDEKVGERLDDIYIAQNRVEYWKGSVSLISRIEYPNGTQIHFNYEDDPGKPRLDAGGIPALKTIVVEKGYDDLSKNTLVYKFNYEYLHGPGSHSYKKSAPYGLNLTSTRNSLGYTTAWSDSKVSDLMSTTLRLKLMSIDRVGTGNVTERYFSFGYNPVALPPRLSPSQDFFGYYNGEASRFDAPIGKHGDMVPLVNLSIPRHKGSVQYKGRVYAYEYGVHKHHNLDFMVAGVLDTIINRYGGRTIFRYKNHILKKNENLYHYREYSPIKSPVDISGATTNDGLCINQIEYQDGYHTENSYTINYCFEDGQQFYNGGYMWYQGQSPIKDYYLSEGSWYEKRTGDYRFWLNNCISKHVYDNGFNHGYGVAEVIKLGNDLHEVSRDMYMFSNMQGPYFNMAPPAIYSSTNMGVVLMVGYEKLWTSYAPSKMNLHNLGLLLRHRKIKPGTRIPVLDAYTEYKLSVQQWYSGGTSYPVAGVTPAQWNSFPAVYAAQQNPAQVTTLEYANVLKKNVVQYEYDEFDNLKKIVQKDSKGSLLTTFNYYSHEKNDVGNFVYKGAFPETSQFLTRTETWKGAGAGAVLISARESWNKSGISLGRYSLFRSLKASSPVPVSGTPVISDDKEFTLKDDRANILEVKYLGQERYSSSIWDSRIGKVVAEVDNARYRQIAYSSFEGAVKPFGTSDFNKGNWDYDPADIRHKSTVARPPVTGNYILELAGGSSHRVITGRALEIGEKFLLTFWANTAPYIELVPDGVGTNQQLTPEVMFSTGDGWQLYRVAFEVTGPLKRSVRITNSNPVVALHLDELRLHPQDAGMTTTAYEPLWGPNSVCDERHNIRYYEYDAFGRPTIVRDRERNILSKTVEVLQGQDN